MTAQDNGVAYTHTVIYRDGQGGLVKHVESNHICNDAVGVQLLRRMQTYRDKVAGLGMRVSTPYHLELNDQGLWEHTRDFGPSLDQRMANGSDPMSWLQQVVRGARPALLQDVPTIGLDLRPGNFCLDEFDRPVYIDFMPPRFLEAESGTMLVGFPQPVDELEIGAAYERYYTAFGMVRRLYFEVMLNCPEAVESFMPMLADELPQELVAEVRRQFDELPMARVAGDLEHLRNEVSKLTAVRHISDLRELAVVAARQQGLDKSFLQHVFKLTHGDFRLPLSVRAARFEQAKGMILAPFGV